MRRKSDVMLIVSARIGIALTKVASAEEGL
jgi:hypothetical protein